jgi:hypothetical protein
MCSGHASGVSHHHPPRASDGLSSSRKVLHRSRRPSLTPGVPSGATPPFAHGPPPLGKPFLHSQRAVVPDRGHRVSTVTLGGLGEAMLTCRNRERPWDVGSRQRILPRPSARETVLRHHVVLLRARQSRMFHGANPRPNSMLIVKIALCSSSQCAGRTHHDLASDNCIALPKPHMDLPLLLRLACPRPSKRPAQRPLIRLVPLNGHKIVDGGPPRVTVAQSRGVSLHSSPGRISDRASRNSQAAFARGAPRHQHQMPGVDGFRSQRNVVDLSGRMFSPDWIPRFGYA